MSNLNEIDQNLDFDFNDDELDFNDDEFEGEYFENEEDFDSETSENNEAGQDLDFDDTDFSDIDLGDISDWGSDDMDTVDPFEGGEGILEMETDPFEGGEGILEMETDPFEGETNPFEGETNNTVDSIDFNDSSDYDFDDADIDQQIKELEEQIASNDTVSDAKYAEDDLDRQIKELEEQIESDKNSTDDLQDTLDDVLANMEDRVSNDSSDADIDGAILDSNSLLGDEADDYRLADKDEDFISPTGEIVVMDPSDDENNFKLVYVDLENIAIVKRIRANNSVEDLVKSIKSTGLLKPVDVAPTNVSGVYVLLDGYRRVLACAKAGKRRVPCVVNTRVSVPEIPILEAMYNHSKKYTIKEMIDYIDYLEKQKGIMSASMIEYLLQMNSGDYTKLKDILNDNDDDIVSKLMDGIFNIETAFKKLEQRRKKESAEEKELKKATRVYEEDPDSGVKSIEESGETGDSDDAMTDVEIQGLNINANNLSDLEDKDLGEMIKEADAIPGFKPHKQDPRYRERLDPTLRKSVLARDENTCKICNMISGMEFTEVLDVHHIHEVYLGGSDDIKNLITACTVCHKLIHLYGRGELHMRPIEEMSEAEQKRFKMIVGLGRIIREDMQKKGMKVDELKKMDNTETIGRTKPGTGQEAG